MNEYRLTKGETETTIGYDDAGPVATVYTCNAPLMRKLQKLTDNPECTLYREDAYSKTFKLPKAWIRIIPTRTFTDERREEMAAIMRERMEKAKAEKESAG